MSTSRRSVSLCLFLCLSILLTTSVVAQKPRPTANTGTSFESLTAGKVVSGFRTVAVYTDESDKAFGARFVHSKTGFTLDVLRIQSVPQGHIWVNSFPVSDMGEPHTQEHLLLGKGSVGRAASSAETMSLVSSNAFTQQLRTSYFFNTAAGPDVYYAHLERQMNALLRPNYTDEEIRREVMNFGITENPADKSLRLEEKGSVYNEMSSSYSRANSLLFLHAGQTVYGPNHPLSYSAGGTPEAIRNLKPEDIKKFHAANYHLGNMGMIASLPKDMALGDVLARTDAILNRLEPQPLKTKFKTEVDLPPAKMAPAGSIKVVEYPHRNEQQPGFLVFVYPATLNMVDPEWIMMELFLDNIAGDATTNLYKKFVDTKTRTVELGAQGVFNFISNDKGNPFFIGFVDVPPANMTEQKVVETRQQMQDEIARIASFKDGSPELTEFNDRIKNRVTEARRGLAKFVNSPPGFGFRNTGSGWMDQLERINKTPGFTKSVTMKSEMAYVDKQLASGVNVWRDYVTKWGLTSVKPYVLTTKPNPQLLKKDEEERAARAAAEIARLKAKYKLTDDQETIKRYQSEYDAASTEIDEMAKKDPRIGFVSTPPMTLDDQLDFKVKDVGGVPLVASTFDNMTSATTGIALNLGSVPEEDLVYLSILPTLLTRVGVIKDGKAISFEEMSELWKKEILGLNSSFSTNNRTGRVELAFRGSGNDAAESKRAVEWMNLILNHPNWRGDNLARIRDVVDQTLSGLRNTMQGSEESWVNDPSTAYRKQDSPLMLTTSSFLTRAHNVHRLRWMLKDPGSNSDALLGFLGKLAAAGQDGKREDLKSLLAAIQGKQGITVPEKGKAALGEFGNLPAGAKLIAVDAAKDLEQLLNDIPDSSLASDWNYLTVQIRHDLLVSPEKTLAALDRVRQGILKTGNARTFVIGSTETQKQLEPNLQSLISTLEAKAFAGASYSATKVIDDRLRKRTKSTDQPVFVGLVNPNTQSGVIMNSAPLATYGDTSRETLLQFIASKLYGGGGSHSIFTKTIGAGLAYSNGIGSSPNSGRENYYAERTPEIPQTLKFVIDELQKAPRDSGLTDYAIAQAFLEFRSASTYEARGESMAADIADGVKPELVRQFRQAVLDLRKTPNLYDELYNRMGSVYAKILPGYDPKLKSVPGAIYFVIGNDKQFVAYEAYLKTTLGAETKLHRLYPRDFWMVMK